MPPKVTQDGSVNSSTPSSSSPPSPRKPGSLGARPSSSGSTSRTSSSSSTNSPSPKIGKSNDKTLSVLDRISPVEQSTTAIRMVVYGNTKTGKTRFAATFPKPLLLIGTEDGTKSIEGISGVDFARIYSSEEYDTLIDHARTTAKYRTVVLDTGGGLQDIILKEVLGLDEIPMSKRWGINIEGSSWGAVVIQTNERLLNALKLSETLGINTIFIAHERSNAESESSTDLGPSVGPALTPKSAGFLNAQCDYVVQTFKKKKYEIERVEILGEVQEISKPLDEVDYCLRVGPSPVYTTGFRVGIWTKTLPPLIYDPSYEKVLEVINGTYKEGEVKDNKGSKDMTSS